MNVPLLHTRPDTTSGMRLGGLCVTNSAYAGAGKPRTGSFLPPQPIPDPQIQIDLRDPEEIARAEDRENDYLLALMDRCFAEVAAEQAVWAEEKRLRQLQYGDTPKLVVRDQDVDSQLEAYLAEERALRQAETGIVDDDDDGRDEHRALAIAHDDDLEEEDDPERDQPAE